MIDTNSTKMAIKQKKVCFGIIQIVELAMILGDHPACSTGSPVQTSWNAQSRVSVNLDEYELTRSPRRSIQELRLSSAARSVM
jgi:hypothetical protein